MHVRFYDNDIENIDNWQPKNQDIILAVEIVKDSEKKSYLQAHKDLEPILIFESINPPMNTIYTFDKIKPNIAN